MKVFWHNYETMKKSLGLTDAEVCRRSNIPKTTISNAKKESKIPRLDTALKISEVLGVSIDQLLKNDITVDPAVLYLKKDSSLRSLVIKLGLHPELVAQVDGYLSGYMDSHGYGHEEVKKEA